MNDASGDGNSAVSAKGCKNSNVFPLGLANNGRKTNMRKPCVFSLILKHPCWSVCRNVLWLTRTCRTRACKWTRREVTTQDQHQGTDFVEMVEEDPPHSKGPQVGHMSSSMPFAGDSLQGTTESGTS